MKRIKTSAAADLLGVTAETVRAYAREGWLTPLRANPDPAVRCSFFFDAAEVEAFARGGAAGAAAYRKRTRKAGAAR